MPVFRGVKNVLLQPKGAERAVVSAEYDYNTREYVITLNKADADKYRDALLAEGLREIDDEPEAKPEPAPEPKPEPEAKPEPPKS